ncbi:MAG: PepSY-like domain-containing protein [Chitinophagaceae bacterium]|nr:PepSY-like domain-containing protein [Chitinophagaceae bacterium]
MKKLFGLAAILLALSTASFAQKEKGEKGEKGEKEGKEKVSVPAVVKTALTAKYPEAKNVTWETEKGNYEANWGGKSGEDHSVQFTPSGEFIEMVKAISVSELPKPVWAYVKSHYKGAKITEAGRVTDAQGKISYEAEVNRRDVIFDENGKFVKAEH